VNDLDFSNSSISLEHESDHTGARLLLLDRLLRVGPDRFDAPLNLGKIGPDARIGFVEWKILGAALHRLSLREAARVQRGVEELIGLATWRRRRRPAATQAGGLR
jgi:hypothetical protein